MKVLFSLVLILFALAYAWVYLRKLPVTSDPEASARRDDRPWRRIGAAICLLVSVMFVLGVYLVDIPDHPWVYAAFWAVIMGLVLWLCGLAVRDLRYTRQMILRRRDRRRHLDNRLNATRVSARDQR